MANEQSCQTKTDEQKDFVLKNSELFDDGAQEPPDLVEQECGGRRLVKKLKETVTDNGYELEFEEAETASNDDEYKYYTQEDYLKGTMKSAPESFFDDIRKTMFPIDPPGDREIWKIVDKEGYGQQMPKKCKLEFHCSFYAEGSDEPFDSSQMRGEPWKISMLDINFVGLQYALFSMKIGEQSRFLIYPKYAFGKRGVPPRIPPNCTVLAEVELLNWVDITGRSDFFSLTYEDRRDASFEVRKSAVDNLNDDAKIKYKQNYFMAASKIYRRVQNILEEARLANDEEEREQRRLLIKAYVNRAVCNIHLKNPKYVITDTKNALLLDPKCGKALYLLGKAHRLLENFDKASKCLLRAQKLVSRQEEVSKELEVLDKLQKKWLEKEKILYQNMFSNHKRITIKTEKKNTDKNDRKNERQKAHVNENLNSGHDNNNLKTQSKNNSLKTQSVECRSKNESKDNKYCSSKDPENKTCKNPKCQESNSKFKDCNSNNQYCGPDNGDEKDTESKNVEPYRNVPLSEMEWIEDFIQGINSRKVLDIVGFTAFEVESLITAIERKGLNVECKNMALIVSVKEDPTEIIDKETSEEIEEDFSVKEVE
ncbi:DgyrCDS11307 [Dimorphilus gyrociliatus]|uniref:peptidylprolyl isomerase n=1 Tax=Dimorphilus gyrociliatus TaxID=2664684 RepID=A0A7I8W3X6_9ANNE|nr:DgyrCDS11307 [Dimorphilus gyrociliatus]